MISVIIPVYNVEPYLRKCLDSVINQTYRDLEILIVDDGSTDGSGRICDEYAEKDEKNSGLLIGSLEEIAYRRGIITGDELMEMAGDLPYGDLLKNVIG